MKEKIGQLLKRYFPSIYKKLLYKKQGKGYYVFKKGRYPSSFLDRTFEPKEKNIDKEIPKTIYTFWTGDNEMSSNRKKGLESLKQKTEVIIELITPKNLEKYILSQFPLHTSYHHLSLVHKSDYLRCYFMHHFGGGYADVKTFKHTWLKAFNTLKKNKNKVLVGYPEIGGIAKVGGQLEKDLVFHISLLVGNGAYICRPQTPFTHEWYLELHHRLDEYSVKLQQYAEREISEYPVPYTYLLGQIFHPLCLKYNQQIIQDKTLMPEFINYR